MTDLRASDAGRERCVAALRHHAGEGRLDTDELDERIGLATRRRPSASSRRSRPTCRRSSRPRRRRRPRAAASCCREADHGPGHLRFEWSRRPLWTFLVGLFLFPVGLLALLYVRREEIAIDLREGRHGTSVTASGIAPAAIRRAFAQLEG